MTSKADRDSPKRVQALADSEAPGSCLEAPSNHTSILTQYTAGSAWEFEPSTPGASTGRTRLACPPRTKPPKLNGFDKPALDWRAHVASTGRLSKRQTGTAMDASMCPGRGQCEAVASRLKWLARQGSTASVRAEKRAQRMSRANLREHGRTRLVNFHYYRAHICWTAATSRARQAA